MFDGDHNGVVHYLGSRYAQQDFVNPALSGQIQVGPDPCFSLCIMLHILIAPLPRVIATAWG